MPEPTVFTLTRQAETPLSTIGLLSTGAGWEGSVWVLEPGANGPHPRVAPGNYKLELRQTLSPTGMPVGKWGHFMSFPALRELIRPGLPHLLPASGPDRLALVHPGNTYHDTEACALPGLTRWTPEMTEDGQWAVGNSQAAFTKIYPTLRDAIQAEGGAIWRVEESFAPKGTES